MKTLIITILLLTLTGFLNAQPRNLDFYLDQAKMNSPLINKSNNENKIVKLNLKQIRSILSKPEINVEANVLFAPIISHDNNKNSFEWVSEGADKYNGYDLAFTDGGQYQAMVSVKQPLFTGSNLKKYSEQQKLTNQTNENAIILTTHEIEQIVGYQYILCLKTKYEIENSLLLLNQVEEQLQTLQKLVNNAIYKQTDLMLLQIEYQNFQLNNKLLLDEQQTNLFDLNLLCGINDTNFVDLQELNLQLKTEPVTNSQFLNSYRLDSMSLITEQKINELKYKPQLYLFANAGMNAVYLPDINRFGFSTGLNFVWNIFDGNQRKIEREKSTIKMDILEFEKKNQIIQNEISKTKVLKQINSIDQRYALIEGQIKKYQNLQNAYDKELSMAEVSIMDYKNLLKEIAAKKQESIMLKIEKQNLINTYNYWNF